MRKIIFLLLTALTTFGYAGQDIVKKFTDLGAPYDGLNLRGSDAYFNLKISKAPRESIGNIKIHIEGTNSTALIRSRSALTLKIKGKILATRTLDPNNPYFTWDITLPTDALGTGYNDLQINAVQHYTYQCEDSQSSELWTTIDTQKSTITASDSVVLVNNEPKLYQLPLVFDQRQWKNRSLNVVFGTDIINPTLLTSANYVAQGVSLMRKDQPLHINVMTASDAASTSGSGALKGLTDKGSANSDVVLIGTRSELSRYLDTSISNTITGPFLGLIPWQKSGAMAVVVSGLSGDDVLLAAKALANPLFVHSASSYAVIEKVPAFESSWAVTPGSTTTFSKLLYSTQTRTGFDTTPFQIMMRTPDDFSGSKDNFAYLRIHFSYSAKLKAGSVMNLFLNDIFIQSIALDNKDGAEIKDFKIAVPTSSILPGLNSIRIAPVLSFEKEQCQAFRPEQLAATVFEDSTIEMPSRGDNPSAPDLERLSRTLWPHNPAFFVLEKKNPQYIAAALTFFSSLAAHQERIIETNALDAADDSKNIVFFGDTETINDNALNIEVPKRAGDNPRAFYPMITQTVANNAVKTFVLAPDGASLLSGLQLISDKNLWDKISGETSIIDTDTVSVLNRASNTTKKVQSDSLFQYIFFSWQNLTVGVVALALAFSFAALAVVRRIKRRRQIQ